jgi:hypothetical protein
VLEKGLVLEFRAPSRQWIGGSKLRRLQFYRSLTELAQ